MSTKKQNEIRIKLFKFVGRKERSFLRQNSLSQTTWDDFCIELTKVNDSFRSKAYRSILKPLGPRIQSPPSPPPHPPTLRIIAQVNVPVLVCLGCHNKYHSMSGIISRNLFSHSFSWLADSYFFFMFSHGEIERQSKSEGEGERRDLWCPFSFIRAQILVD